MVTYQLQVAWLPRVAGRAGDRRAVHPALRAVLGHQRPAGRQAREDGADPLRQEPGDRHHGCWRPGASCAADVPLLLACVFLMGLHSTLFGPVKFAYLPQHLNERELTGGNGMVEMGTFVAILLGQRGRRAADRAAGDRRGLGRRAPAWRWRWPGACWRRRCRCRRPPTPACASTGTRSPRPGATCGWRTATWSSSARCWASAGCGSSAPCSWRSSRRSRRTCCTATSMWPRCCWWCSRWAWASARCCARC